MSGLGVDAFRHVCKMVVASADNVAARANSIIEGDEQYRQSASWCSRYNPQHPEHCFCEAKF